MIPKPEVGTMVHYQVGGKVWAAIVTEVDERDFQVVSLCVLKPTGPEYLYGPEAVRYDETGTIGTWHWMPV